MLTWPNASSTPSWARMRLASASSSIASVSLSGTMSPCHGVFVSEARAPGSRRQIAHVEGANGALQALEVEFAERLNSGDRFDGNLDPAVDQDLSVGGLG